MEKLRRELLKIITANPEGISWEGIKQRYFITGIDDKKFDDVQNALTKLAEARKISIQWIPCQGTNLYSPI